MVFNDPLSIKTFPQNYKIPNRRWMKMTPIEEKEIFKEIMHFQSIPKMTTTETPATRSHNIYNFGWSCHAHYYLKTLSLSARWPKKKCMFTVWQKRPCCNTRNPFWRSKTSLPLCRPLLCIRFFFHMCRSKEETFWTLIKFWQFLNLFGARIQKFTI